MAKRMTVSTKYRDPWFRQLKPEHKLFYDFLYHECDHAGVWEPDWPSVEFHLGIKVDPRQVLSVFSGRIFVLDNKKWYLPKFIDIQYGGREKLNPKNNVHSSVIEILEKERVDEALKRVSAAPLCGAKEGVQEGAIDIDRQGAGEGQPKKQPKPKWNPPTTAEVDEYCRERKNDIDASQFVAFYTAKNWMIGKNKMTDWKAAVITWEKRKTTPVPPARAATPEQANEALNKMKEWQSGPRFKGSKNTEE